MSHGELEILVPRLCLGTRGLAGSAGYREAEPGTQWVTRQSLVTRSVIVTSSVFRWCLALLSLTVIGLAGCHQDMADQPKYEALEASTFFSDGRASRQPPVGTVARGHLRLDEHLYFGKVDGKPAETFPRPIDAKLLARGQERFNIYCAPCHGRVGDGEGMVVQRGFPHPPSYHIDRLREAPVGHYFDVISNGFGRMPSYSGQITADDRWAIISYIRALQLSQNAKVNQLIESDKKQLAETETAP